ncbi:MAG: hypothetical protein ACTSPY_10850 [Candidatus Helarchaeota archaeon]
MLKNLHLLKMEKTGPEVISIYPKSSASEDIIKKNVLKLLPFNAKHGETFTLTSDDKLLYLSYIFILDTGQGSRPDLYAIGVVYNPFEDYINYSLFFQTLIDQMLELKLLNDKILLELIPKLYMALKHGKTNIEIKKNVTININFNRSRSGKKERTIEERANDLW